MVEKRDEYIQKLSQKDPMHMTFQELQDWLDHCIYDKMKYYTFNAVQKDTFDHLVHYFRLNQFALHLIMAKAENSQYFIKSMMLLLKEKNPELVDVIFEMVGNMTKEHNMELVKDETPEDAQRIIDRANELMDDYDSLKTNRPCKKCGAVRIIVGDGLCNKCYYEPITGKDKVEK